jgi:hypothetical protein
MTISEFIYAFDEDSIYAEYDEQGNVYIYDNTYDSVMARLGINSFVWEVEDDTFTMSPSLLRSMAKLADTPPDRRIKPRKYVILNGVPRHGTWVYFKIGDDSEYLRWRITSDPEVLKMGSYTFAELEKEKRRLPEEWHNLINSLLTPLDIALEEGKA